MQPVLQRINDFVWGVPALLMILFTGVRLSFLTNLAQFRYFSASLRLLWNRMTATKQGPEGVSPFQSLCTALAATVGTGNIAGVAGAICIGGPGTVFWLWVCAFLGMILKFAEATLAVHYRRVGNDGCLLGGPMYLIEQGMGKRYRWLACLYCFFGVIAAFGVGNATQINAVIVSINEAMGWRSSAGRDVLIGAVLASLAGVILLGGAKRIGSFAEKLVPFAAAAYILLGLGVIVLNANRLPFALRSVFVGAFTPGAFTGGVVGSFFLTLRTGVSRGVFTNEAGMGTAGMSYAGAKVSHPVEQGMMGIVEVFLDTIVICTITALAILCSGVEIPYGIDIGAALTSQAFSSVYGFGGSVLLAAFISCFAFATMLGWGLYGMRCAQYLLGEHTWKAFVVLQMVLATVCSALGTQTVWLIAEIVNGLMAIPNLVAILFLGPVLVRLIHDHEISKGLIAVGGTNESFNQCKSLRTLSYEKVPSSGCGGRASGKKDLPSEHRSA